MPALYNVYVIKNSFVCSFRSIFKLMPIIFFKMNGGASGKEFACQRRRGWFHPRARKIPPGEGNDIPLQYSCLGNPMDRGTWWTTDQAVSKSQTPLNVRGHVHTHTHRHTDTHTHTRIHTQI